ncbi:MAG: DUF2007 domain-containing protein [Anaerolineales bacterium]|nr:DUF2007 domain-containing protein [Anaerolineales bacterium]
MTDTSQEWKVVDQVAGSTQAQILKGLLEANGIQVVLSEEGAGRAFGLAAGPMAEVDVLVPASSYDQAKELLKDYYSGDIEDVGQDESEDDS